MSSIQKRDNGKWRARYRDAAGKEHARHFARKIDAQKWLDEVTTMMVTGNYVAPQAGRLSLRAFYEQWAANQIWVPTTQMQNARIMSHTPFFDHPLSAITPTQIESWVKSMVADGKAPSTIKQRVNTVSSVFKAAIRDRRLTVDPTVGVVLPRKRRKEAAMAIPLPHQVRMLADASEEHRRILVFLGAFAGLRLGEASALRVQDIDFLRREIKISRQIQKVPGGSVEFRAPKYGSERIVFAPNELIQLISSHIQQFGTTSDGLLVSNASGGPLGPSSFGHWWTSTAKAAKVEGFTFHSLRHYYASGLIAAGCSVTTVQRSLGHSKASVTLDTYAHLWPSSEDHTRRATAQMMEEASRGLSADHA